MPRFEPFSGLRYDPTVPLDDVICPPYDVVGPVERTKLASRHRANAIHVELPQDDPGERLDRYRAAARLFETWTDQGILRRDTHRCFYVYRMTEPSGQSTTGVIGALGCDPRGGDVLPHEQTIPKDMTDRLELLRACHVNTSPIWGLSLSEGVAGSFQPSGPPSGAATDDSGVLHELWVVDDPRSAEAISQGVARAPVVIADGHHRYQTALAYRDERRNATQDVPGDYDFVMALIVELADDQLSVGAIHRMLSGISDRATIGVFEKWFDCEHLGRLDADLVDEVLQSKELALASDDALWRLTGRDVAFREAGSDLDSALVGLATADLGADVGYTHDPLDAVASLQSGAVDGVVLMRPVKVAQISAWAREGRRMPPKSTYFHPKPRTGMVFRSLAGD